MVSSPNSFVIHTILILNQALCLSRYKVKSLFPWFFSLQTSISPFTLTILKKEFGNFQFLAFLFLFVCPIYSIIDRSIKISHYNHIFINGLIYKFLYILKMIFGTIRCIYIYYQDFFLLSYVISTATCLPFLSMNTF